MFDYSADGEIPRFVGIWNLESYVNLYASDNAHKYAFDLYCRKAPPVLPAKNFCDGKKEGSYDNAG